MGHVYWRNRILGNLQAFAKTRREEKKEAKNLKSRYKTLKKKPMVVLMRRACTRKLFTRFWVFYAFFPYLPNLPKMIILQV